MYLPTNEVYEVKDYPYGRLRTSMFFSVEFNAKKGFRSVRQSIDPKTGRINKPKKSTYSDLMLLDVTDGFAKVHAFSFYHMDKFNELCHLIGKNYDLFTPEQIEYLYLKSISFIKLTLYSMANYAGSEVKDMLPIVDPTMKLLVEGLKSKTNVFSDINLDHEALENTKVEGYNPFRVTYHK